jgi:hypothetical protein
MWISISKWAAVCLLAVCVLTAPAAAGEVPAASAATGETPASTTAPKATASTNEWRFSAALYGYFPAIGGKAANGKNFSVDFNDIFDNLDFAFMGMVGAYKGKWSFLADALYMDVSGDNAGTVTLPLTERIDVTENVKADMNLKAWVVTPTVGYDLLDRGKFNLTLVGGLRYLWIDTTFKVKRSNRYRYRENKVSGSQSNWDGIVGVRGQVLLTGKWYLPYYGDIGTGDSDLTWQVWGGVGYRFKHFDLVGGYRYMAWNFDDDDYIVDDLNMSGPFIGAVFTF